VRDKKKKREMFAERALAELKGWIEANGVLDACAARAP
jgi:folate-dependent tRNA-U54 methylase TrmFO/GidA